MMTLIIFSRPKTGWSLDLNNSNTASDIRVTIVGIGSSTCTLLGPSLNPHT